MALTKLDKNLLGFSDDTDFVKLPSGTTAQRPGSAAAGQFRFNTTIGDAEIYNGTAWVRMGTAPPTYSSVDYPGDDTALDPAGGQSLIINGGTFNTGITLTIGGTTPSSITRNSSTQLTVTAPAKTAGSYSIVFTNTDGGTATATNVVSYNGIPAFSVAAGSLGSKKDGETVSLSVAATEPDSGAITHTVTSGALPSGLSLNASTGAITGTAPSVSASTTYSFTITATDNENQSVSRAYSITITPKTPSENFNIKLYTGNGSAQSLTGVGFKPDIIWVKQRSGTNPFAVYDSSRGAGKLIRFDNYEAESGNSGNLLASFDTDGFSVNRNYLSHTAYDTTNHSGSTYVAWCWRVNGGTTSSNTTGEINTTVQVNDDAGVSIVQFAGIADPGVYRNFGHGLSAEPDFIIMKRREANQHPAVFAKVGGKWEYFDGMTSTDGGGDYSSGIITTSTLIDIQDYAEWFADAGHNYVYWCWRNVEGYSKFGVYSGNGSVIGPIVETGFEPAMLIIKRQDSTDNWTFYDNKRNTLNPKKNVLFSPASDAELTSGLDVDFLANGFQVREDDNSINNSSGTYIYAAFAADPDTTTPTLADSFNVKTYTGNGGTQTITGIGFNPSLIWMKRRNSAQEHALVNSVSGVEKLLYSDLHDGEQTTTNGVSSFNADGWTMGANGLMNNNTNTYVAWAWKAEDNEPTIHFNPQKAVYKFNSGVTDEVGSYNGTASNVTYTTGKFGNSIVSNGSDSEVALGFSAPSTKQSYSFWLYPTANSGIDVILQTGGQYEIAYESGKLYVMTGGSNRGSGVAITQDEWSHWVFTYNGSGTHKIYKNGSLAETITSQTPSSFGTIKLFSTPYGSWGPYAGRMDQLRIFTTLLGASEVTALYNEITSNNSSTTHGSPAASIVSANTNAGFSIVEYEGDGVTTKKIPHGLGGTPEMIFHKRLDGNGGWVVNHANMTSGYEAYLHLNSAQTNSMGGDGGMPNGTQNATTLGFQVGSSSVDNVNKDGYKYIAYCWRSIAGYSKFGAYNGSGSAVSVDTGFQADWVMIKRIDSSGAWNIFDSVRGGDRRLYADTDTAETDESSDYVTFDSDGFNVTVTSNADLNTSGGTFIYAAFKIN